MVFKDPWILLALLLLPLLFFRRDKSAVVSFSSRELAKGLKPTAKLNLRAQLIFLRLGAAALFIFALARPQAPLAKERVFKEGIDCVLVLDTSTSMEALDFKVGDTRHNRLYVVKKTVEDFISGRVNDRMGMIAFAVRPYVVCPLTLDHAWLITNLERVKIGMVEDGTAIGSAIMAGLNRLKNSTAKTKIMVLLTDGRNNAGKISPLTAAEAAKALKIKIYTIGAGSLGAVPYPVKDVFGQVSYQYVQIDLDEDSLQKIAGITNARYFRATDTASLKKIYAEIDRLEKTPFKQPQYAHYKELFGAFLLLGIILLLLEQVLTNTLLMKIP